MGLSPAEKAWKKRRENARIKKMIGLNPSVPLNPHEIKWLRAEAKKMNKANPKNCTKRHVDIMVGGKILHFGKKVKPVSGKRLKELRDHYHGDRMGITYAMSRAVRKDLAVLQASGYKVRLKIAKDKHWQGGAEVTVKLRKTGR